jgi:hypothetical protein
MMDILKYSDSIKLEADELWHKFEIIETLKKFGKVKLTGSFELNLMYKKDIDISLINDDLSVPDFTQLGKELIDRLDSPSVYYRNTRITPVEKRPENALYWGIKTGEWFLDIWAMSNSVYSRAEEYISDIKSKLNKQNRMIILKLKAEFKENGSYGKGFGSREIYDSVLNYNVTSPNQFEDYLITSSIKNQYF